MAYLIKFHKDVCTRHFIRKKLLIPPSKKNNIFAKKIHVLKKNFIINLAFLLLLNLLIKPFWIFGVERTVQNIVGAEEFGFYFSLLNFSLLFNIILDVGITNSNNRNIAQNHSILSKHVSNIVSLKFLLAVAYAIITISVALIIGYSTRQISFLMVLVFNQFLLSFILYLRSNISGLHLFKTDSFMSVLDRLLMIIICSIIIWGSITEEPIRIEWFIFAQTGAYFITAITALFIVLNKASFFKLNFSFKFFRVFLKQSLPFAILILLMAFYNRIDSVMLERLLHNGKEQAGIYAQAFRILEGASMFAYLFSVLLLPMFAKMIKKNQDINELLKLSSLLILVPAIILAVNCHFFNYELMDLMYVEHVDKSAPVLSLLITGFIGISLTYIFGTLLTSNGNLTQLNIMAGGGMLLNVILNLILIPKYMVIGSAIASMTTQLLTALSQIVIAKYVFGLKINIKLMVSFVAFTGFYILSTYFIKTITENWIIAFIASATIGLLISFLTGLFKIKEVVGIIKSTMIKQA